jgi:hypothetical protein
MTQAVVFIAVFGLGLALGGFLRGSPQARKRIYLVAGVVFGAPVALLLFASVVGSDTLGLVGGLSLMVMFSLAPLLGIGMLAGWLLARGLRPNVPVDVEPKPRLLLRDLPPSPPPASFTRVPFDRSMLLIAASIASGFWVFIAVGFRLDGQRAPMGLDAGLLPAALVLLGTVVMGVRHAWPGLRDGIESISLRWSGRRELSREMAQYHAWAATLALDPKRKRYADMIAAGDYFWTAERVEYDLDPHATTCCPHVAPIEAAMREEGLQVQLHTIGFATAKCTIDAQALATRFSLPDGVGYREIQTYDRSEESIPIAIVGCTACRSHVAVEHARTAPENTPVFPA